MRLIEVSEHDGVDELPNLIDFPPDQIPKYAILSHRWNVNPADEVLFADIMYHDVSQISMIQEKKGYQKLQYSCKQALGHQLKYVWIDTCCIDKSSSAELSEAINSMFEWYNKATVCYGYLEDVPSTVDVMSYDSELTKTVWATRGWTLQELIAPSEMIFYSGDWCEIGTRDSLSTVLSVITGIDEVYLTRKKALGTASVAKRMSWAARRYTSRPEDIAYCLMGIFQVNMPLLYGEGEKAFVRLQEEIMKHTDDHSLFAWTDEDKDENVLHGLLAKHPKCFKHSGSIVPYQDRELRTPFSMSNRGLCIELHLTKLATESLYAAALDCPVPPNFEDSSFLAIYLKKLPGAHGQYARVKVGCFGEAHERGSLQTIYVRQSIIVPDIEGIYPSHVFQLRKFTTRDPGYRVVETIVPDVTTHHAPAIMSTQTTRGWIPPKNPTTCRIINKGDNRAIFAAHIVYEEMEGFVVLLGTAGLQVGFDVIETRATKLGADDQFNLLRQPFAPLRMGTEVRNGYHRILVSTESLVLGAAKYYMIDIQVDALERPRRLSEAIGDIFDALDLKDPEPYHAPKERFGMMRKLRLKK